MWLAKIKWTNISIPTTDTLYDRVRKKELNSKGKNTHTAERGGAERPAVCDLIRGKKSTALFPRINSPAAGRSAPLYVFLP
jgi:hypothetical protein